MALQEYGYVGISQAWARSNFDIHDFAHEFGHYLQQVEMGFSYQYRVALPSIINITFYGGAGHDSMPYEKDATARGEAYLREHLR